MQDIAQRTSTHRTAVQNAKAPFGLFIEVRGKCGADDDHRKGRAGSRRKVNIETVRFCERRGLIERPPKGKGYRVYSPEQVARIRFIKEAQLIGFSLSEIGDLLALRADPAADCSEVRR